MFKASGPKISPKNQLNIYFVTGRQYWLGTAKPKNVFRSTLSFAPSCFEILKISYLTEFSTDWLSDAFGFLLFLFFSLFSLFFSYVVCSKYHALQSALDKHNSEMAKVIYLHWSSSLCPETCLVTNHSSSNACLMVLPKLAFVLLRTLFLSPLLHRWQFVRALHHGFMENLVTAVIVEVFLTLSFAWNVL